MPTLATRCRMLCAVALIAVFFGGCAQRAWYKEGVSDEQAIADFNEAKYDAVKYNNSPGGFDAGMREQRILRAAMESKGYRLISNKEAAKLGVKRLD